MNNPIPIAATYSKDPRFFGSDFYPRELIGGTGAYVYDRDHRVLLDWISALGAISLGYGDQLWDERVRKSLHSGAGFSLPHVLERQVAEKIVNLLGPRVPGWCELGVRFGLSGSDATNMAVRLCRAATGRSLILSNGYHGWGSEFVAATPPAWGVIGKQYIKEFAWGIAHSEDYWPATSGHSTGPSLDECFARNRRVAAVIIEVLPEDPPPGWFDHIRQLCDKHGALFILDEVVTSLRYGLGGAAERYGISPDLICVGKALGNGLPISCIVGRRDLFDWFDPDCRPNHDPVFVSSTHFGNAVSLAAADAVLDLWTQDSVDHIWDIGRLLMADLRRLGYTVAGHPPRSLIQFDSQYERAFFIREMAARGILINRPNLPNLAHSEKDVQKTAVAAAVVKEMMIGRDLESDMAGKLPLTLFANR